MEELLVSEEEFWGLLIDKLDWYKKDYARVLNLLAGLFAREAEENKKEGCKAIARHCERDFDVIYSYLKERGYYEE